MFERIDKEEDGEVYLREVVDFLAVLDNNIEQSHQVRLGFIGNDKWARGDLFNDSFDDDKNEVSGLWTNGTLI